MRSLTGPKPVDVTRMSECGRSPGGHFLDKPRESLDDSLVARAVHGVLLVLTGAAMTACVVPPPLEVDRTDAGLNSPPIISSARDSALNSLRPPATLTVNTNVAAPATAIDLVLLDLDVEDELTVKMFVDYDLSVDPARVTCIAPPSIDGMPIRTLGCTTSGLCLPEDVGTPEPHLLEIELYDTPPDPNTPYRVPSGDGLFSTWTLSLVCVDVPIS